MNELTEKLLSLPTNTVTNAARGNDVSKTLEVAGENAVLTVNDTEPRSFDEEGVQRFLERQGLNPAQWEVTGARASEWTMGNGETGTSQRFTLRRVAGSDVEPIDVEALFDTVRNTLPSPPPTRSDDGIGVVIAIGDMQVGKASNDAEVLVNFQTMVSAIDAASRKLHDVLGYASINHLHIAWLGDHIEGFTSQGGANVWRTRLGLTDQLRAVRRYMLHTITELAPFAARVTTCAVPGNHGRVSVNSKSETTTFEDNYDVDCLVAVADACKLNPEAYGHVEFYVPETDEMTVTLDVEGVRFSHAHGHKWRHGKHWEWWRGQAFGESPLRDADVLLAGHLHHFNVDTSGKRWFIQTPALEAESDWWRHLTGEQGNPGVVFMTVGDGDVRHLEVLR